MYFTEKVMVAFVVLLFAVGGTYLYATKWNMCRDSGYSVPSCLVLVR
jgi:hypothetical protein